MKGMPSFLVLVVISLVFFKDFVDSKPSRDRNNKPYRVVCYWGTWAFYRPGNGKYQAEDINPHICTHILYGFAKLSGDRIALYDPDLDDGDTDWNSGLKWGHGMIRRMNHLRDYDPHLSTMISIGGWNEGSNKYSQMVRDASQRKTFVESVLKLLKEFDLDGLDLDWEYPAMAAAGDADRKPGRDQDKQDFISLIKELHEAFEPHGYILSSAVSAGKPTIDRAYDVPSVSKYLDFINLMSYDYHGGWDNVTAHNAPLYPYANYTGIFHEFTVSYSIDYWLKLGVDPKKLVLGLPFYGRTFTLASQSEYGIGAKVTGHGGESGQITRTIGMLGYNEICGMIKNGWKLFRDSVQKIPYAVHANQWIGYDDSQSIGEKLQYLISHKLGGAMIWSLDTDDFGGHCFNKKYPLLKLVSKTLNQIDGPDETIHEIHVTTPHNHQTNKPTTKQMDHNTKKPHNTTKKPHQHETTKKPHQHETTKKPNGKFICKHDGFFGDPENPRKFHQCVERGGKFEDYSFMCGERTHYDDSLHVCVND